MRNIKLILEYEGTNYCGWQTQPNLPTIQGTIEKSLTQLTNTPTQIVGAGRTDTGVHAEGQVANFHTASEIPTVAFQKGLNAILPSDIVVSAANEVPANFHARFKATSRRYRYTILNRPYRSALLWRTCHFHPKELDVDSIDTICKSIFGRRDFSSFQKTGSNRINPICEVIDAGCWKNDEFVYIEIEADSFLRGMVRAIVGTALKCTKDVSGNVDRACNQFHRILKAKDRSVAGTSAPANGLALIRVKYNEKSKRG
ncbi:tRNA pseudouridine(38-40) synthase TruA [Candidatus Poribacteria bacterium]|nr:tRNA pseudouridine(38-40) synthase TruA [Candidatus Poribacteria bacterium]